MTPLDSHELSVRAAAEIRSVRKGRGLQASDLGSRLGPLLRELAGPGEDAAAHRLALIAEVSRLTARLVDDQRMAIEASLALSAETIQQPHFQERVEWLAARIKRDYRTALRRIDATEGRLGEEIATELRRRRALTPAGPEGWYIEELRTLLRLDSDVMVSEEDRRIVSTSESLTEVRAWFDLPEFAGQAAADVQVELRYGGRRLVVDQPSRNHFQLTVQLPQPLERGQAHEYGLMVRMPREMMRSPHYLVSPECRCDKFELKIRFNPERSPGWIRRVDGETVRTFQKALPVGDLLVADRAGEVQQEFRNLTRYLGYGIQWQPDG